MQHSLVAAVVKARIGIYSAVTIALASLITPAIYAVDQTDLPVTSAADDGGVVVEGSGNGETVESATTSGPGPISRTWSNFVDWFLEVTDLKALSTKSVAWTILHGSLLIVGLVLAVFGSRTYEWLRKHQQPHSMVQGAAVRIGGVALVLLAFII